MLHIILFISKTDSHTTTKINNCSVPLDTSKAVITYFAPCRLQQQHEGGAAAAGT